MKKEVVFLLVLFFGISIVSAQTNCNDNQVILRLSALTNAHGEIANIGNYQIEVCYDQIFGNVFDVNAQNPNVCNGNNKILRLSSNTNAHAESPFLPPSSYQDVCYGDLACTLTTASVCIDPNKIVVRLSDETNAHLSITASANYNNYVICCSQGGTGTSIPSDIYWADMKGEPIPAGNKVYVGNKIQMIASNTGLSNGDIVTFTVYDDDGIDDLIRTETANVDNNGKAVKVIELTRDDFDISDNDEPVGSPGLDLYFEVDYDGDLESNRIDFIGQVRNLHPNPQFAELEHRGIYFTGKDILFRQDSYDRDGEIANVQWSIVEGDVNFPKSFARGSAGFESFSLIGGFSTPGQKTITLRAIDDDGAEREKQIGILVIQGSENKLFTFIEKPKHHDIITATDRRVDFSGEESYVIQVSSTTNPCPIAISCLQGNCPDKTKGVPDSDCDIDASNSMIIGGTRGNFNNLFFEWIVDNSVIRGTGDLSRSGTKTFNTFSNSLNDKTILLDLSYPDDLNPMLNRIFERKFTLGQCLNDGQKAIVFNRLGDSYYLVDVVGDFVPQVETPPCALNGQMGDGYDCCPTGDFCGIANGQAGCYGIDSPDNRFGCDVYNDAQYVGDINPPVTQAIACNNDVSRLVRQDLSYNRARCEGGGYACTCSWDISLNPAKCIYTETVNGNDPTNNNEECAYECLYNTISSGQCIEGYREFSVDTQFVGIDINCPGFTEAQTECQAKDEINQQVICGRPEIELGFFGIEQFFISLIGILIIYTLFGKLRRFFK